jgi:hypothetical protein
MALLDFSYYLLKKLRLTFYLTLSLTALLELSAIKK